MYKDGAIFQVKVLLRNFGAEGFRAECGRSMEPVMRRYRYFGTVGLAILVLAPAVLWQLCSAQSSGNQITLDVQVVDKSGAPIRGLQQQDFTLLDDNHNQTIASFQAVDSKSPSPNDPPVQLVLVVDAINTPFVSVSSERGEVHKYLTAYEGELPHPLSLLVATSKSLDVLKSYSKDGAGIDASYETFQTGLRGVLTSQGVDGEAERFSNSVVTFDSVAKGAGSARGRKLVIWLSPGWPLLTSTAVQISEEGQRKIFNSVVNASNELVDGRITLYTIDPVGGNEGDVRQRYTEFLKGVPSASKALPANVALQVLSVQSGGRVFYGSNDLTGEIEDCAADADAYYVLTFDAPKAGHDDEYHSLAVKVDKPGAVVHTRTGYYAEP